MASATPSATRRLRKSICDAIIASVGISQDVGAPSGEAEAGAPTGDHISTQLDGIFTAHFHARDNTSDGNFDDDDGVTPLIVACDKYSVDALEYLRHQIQSSSTDKRSFSIEQLVEAWGHPTAATSSCGNSAAHHAMAAGFIFGLDTLLYFWGRILDEDGLQDTRLNRCCSLISQTNQNGDTPIMMACVSGHNAILHWCVEQNLKLALRTPAPGMEVADPIVKKAWQTLADIFNMKNVEDCRSLNLACGYGHADTIKFLIRQQNILRTGSVGRINNLLWDNDETESGVGDAINTDSVLCLEPLVNVTYKDVDFCKEAVKNLADGLNFMKQHKQEDKIEEFTLRHKKASDCLILLEHEFERLSTKMADELLRESQKISPNACSNKSKAKAKKKKKQRRANSDQQLQARSGDESKKTAQEDASDIDTNASNDNTVTRCWNVVTGTKKESESDLHASPFITLQDGVVISQSQRAEYEPDQSPLEDETSSTPISSGGTEPKTLQSILESTSSSLIPSDASNADIAGTMESLVLEPAMLLLSPHGMAMEMSPCQLDAVESILRHQLNSTRKARNIQRRLLDKKNATSSVK